MPARRHAPAALALCALACGGGTRETFHPRPVVLVSRHTEVDTLLARARSLVAAGDLAGAAAALTVMLGAYPTDPVAPLARALAARVSLAQGNTAPARILLGEIPGDLDPAVDRSRRLGLSALDVREGRYTEAIVHAEPVVGRLPDRADAAELGCVLATAAAHTSHPDIALRALVDLENARQDDTFVLATVPSCAGDAAREALLASALAGTDDPTVLSTTIDALPAGAPMRRALALRLRELAAARHELPQWLRWLVDLPDEVAVAPVDPQHATVTRVTLGVLAPLHGERTSVGAAILRGVEYSLEGVGDVVIAPEDEGETPEQVTSAIEHLADRNVRAIVGISRADLSGAAAIAAQSRHVHLFLLAATEGVDETGDFVHLAGPTQETRESAFRRVVLGRGRHVAIAADPTVSDSATMLERDLEASGMLVQRARLDPFGRLDGPRDPAETYVFLGATAREARLTYVLPPHHDPVRWVLDARGAPPVPGGTYIGLAAGAALDELRALHCTRTGEAPDELVLLAHDAARTALSTVRTGDTTVPAARALEWPARIVTGTVDTSGNVVAGTPPAAAARCAVVHESAE